MPKITSEQKLKAVAEENALYLIHLRGTGNATLAARFAKRSREAFAGRRRADSVFDAECAAALVFARAALAKKGGAAPPPNAAGGGLLARGGEYMVGTNLNNGLQVRRARAGHVTAKGEDVFLQGLAATANIQLSAEAVGVDPRVFYKRRAQSPEFAQRMQDALKAGYEAVEFALLKTALRSLAPEAAGEGVGAAQDAGPIEPARMSVDQAMTLIAQRAKTTAIGERHAHGAPRQLPTPEETDGLLLKRLELLARKRARNPNFLRDGRERGGSATISPEQDHIGWDQSRSP